MMIRAGQALITGLLARAGGRWVAGAADAHARLSR